MSSSQVLRAPTPVVRPRSVPGLGSPRTWWPLAAVALTAAALRVPYLHAPLSSDEGGFLVVARGWRAGGGSLYGGHWVDRPPVLLAIYKVATLFGGVTAVRVIGAVAVAMTVFLVGAAAARAAGRRAGLTAAVVAAALLVSPLLGTIAANGELLAAPFVAGGLCAVTFAYTSDRVGVVRGAAVAAGACAVLAVGVKQNMVDVLVFAAILGLAAWRTGQVGLPRLRDTALCGVAGFASVGALVLGGAAALGSSPGGVLYAMYPFRVRAAGVLSYVPWSLRWARIEQLGELFLSSVGPLLLAMLLVGVMSRRLDRRTSPLAVATLGLAGYAVVSILAGGSYWSHYLVQLVVPTALAAGLAASGGPRLRAWLRPAVGITLVVALLGWVAGMRTQVDASGALAGQAVATVAAPGDSVVNLLGDGAFVESSGLAAPYPYLWSLPSRTLDPRLETLTRLLRSPRPPTWIAIRGLQTRDYVEQRPAGALITQGYRLAGVVCGRSVYLRDGLHRPALAQPPSCHLPLT